MEQDVIVSVHVTIARWAAVPASTGRDLQRMRPQDPVADVNDMDVLFQDDVAGERAIVFPIADAQLQRRGIRSRSAIEVRGEGLETKHGRVIEVSEIAAAGSKLKSVKTPERDKDGKHKIVIDSSGDKIQILCDSGNVEIKASAGKVQIDAGEAEIKASGRMTLASSAIWLLGPSFDRAITAG